MTSYGRRVHDIMPFNQRIAIAGNETKAKLAISVTFQWNHQVWLRIRLPLIDFLHLSELPI